ncbi:lipid A deacylase LpxR family protein [Marinomonas foliarum]|jgi:lipid A 3-O-deacylase|uniref:Lipid A deacylase LpxR family protein n=1 Tax=Marinomonas foliarum TaxID=491950 RepID=A0ABX7IME1_9GAMM|nr:lipid A deacylase LpxR family protein [Marinomonas foliarum]QRV23480.1 lipid A deacylase LpxR family protein [Marinomonas foliarum]
MRQGIDGDDQKGVVRGKGEVVESSLNLVKYSLISLSLLFGVSAYANESWVSATLDNDFFVNEDNGYTNGLYVTFYDVNESGNDSHWPDFWVKPLMWTMSDAPVKTSANVYSVGQTLNTAEDLTLANPPQGSFPYSAMISINNTYITTRDDHADRVSTTIGIVGPWALGKETQKAVHKVISAQDPKGWNTQLHNELVFELSRSRVWRSWVSEEDTMDVLTGFDVSAGTLKSSTSTGIMFRYGRNLESSYATTLLAENRMSNPTATDNGWFVYAGVKVGYTFNQIFTDGNTFRDSRSIDYDHNTSVLSTGVSYAWDDIAIAFAINSPFTINGDKQDREIDRFTRYGTMTFAWQI